MLVDDLRSGMVPAVPIGKYHFSTEGFQNALKLLLEANAITWTEFKNFKSADCDQIVPRDSRRTPRNQPIPVVTVCEVGKPGARYLVRDISEEGIGIIGIRAQIDESKSLAVVGDEFGEIAPFEFEAQCRWVKQVEPDGSIWAGFRIVTISEQDVLRLREFIRGFTFGIDN